MNSNQNMPDGHYVVEVVQAQYTRTDEGEAFFCWEFKIAQGQYAGDTLRKTMDLNSEFGTRQLNYDLQSMGFIPADQDELQEFCQKVVGQRLAVRVANGQYQRIYVNGFAKQNRKGQWFQVAYRPLAVE